MADGSDQCRLRALAVTNALDRSCVIGLVEHAGAAHNRVGASFDHLPGIAAFDAAIHFDPGIEATLIAHAAQITDLLNLVLNEALTAEAWVDAHDQHQIAQLEAVLEGVQGGAGVQHRTRHFAEVLDLGQVAVQVRAGLNLNRNDVGAGFGEVRDVLLRLNNHQVNVQGLLGHRTQCLNNERPNGDVGNKAAVHHVHMDPISTGFVHGFHFFSKA